MKYDNFCHNYCKVTKKFMKTKINMTSKTFYDKTKLL